MNLQHYGIAIFKDYESAALEIAHWQKDVTKVMDYAIARIERGPECIAMYGWKSNTFVRRMNNGQLTLDMFIDPAVQKKFESEAAEFQQYLKQKTLI